MNRFCSLLCTLLLLSPSFCWSQDEGISFLPDVQEIEPNDQTFELSYSTYVTALSDNGCDAEAAYLQEWLNDNLILPVSYLVVGDTLGLKSFIHLETGLETDKGPEAYEIDITSRVVLIKGASPAGVFHGIQTFLQTLPVDIWDGNENVEMPLEIPGMRIRDFPKFEWRSMLLDCSRHFMDKDFVIRYIDLLAYHKMNTLHWHLVDDQGWRLEIDAYPLLTEVGAWRKDVHGEGNGTRYGGYYSKEDVREIIEHAKVRHVNIVPEIEMPGHSMSALAAYPEHSCTGGPFEVETEWGVFKEIYCPGKESTFEFIETVLAEVMDMFPSKYIHIGGDEVPKFRWEQCKKCQARMKKEELESTEELQSYFLSRVNDYLKENGRVMVGWDEILDGGLPSGAVVQSWRSFEGAKAAIALDAKTIVSPTSHAYFDYDLKSIDLKKVYEFDPIPQGTSKEKEHLVLGGSCNMWSERAPQFEVDNKVFPRILAMCEVLWTDPSDRNYDGFYARARDHYNRLDRLNVNYGYGSIPVKMHTQYDTSLGTVVRLEKGNPDLDVFFTMDGSEPDKYSIPYDGAFGMLNDATLKIQAFKKDIPFGDPVEKEYIQHKLIGVQPKIEHLYAKQYNAGGYYGVCDGWKGTADFRDGHWQGYQFDDFIATFDVSGLEEINEVSAGFYQYNNSWIFIPTELIVQQSDDGENFEDIGSVLSDVSPEKRGKFTHEMTMRFKPRQTKFLRIVAKNIQHCPEWHEAAGSEAWLFVDEIIVR